MSKRRSPHPKAAVRAEPGKIAPGNLLGFAALLCATLVAYVPALGGALLWDDDRHVTRAALRSLHGLWRIWFDVSATDQYYPLVNSAFWLEHRIWGDHTLGYHLTNVALHALAAFLLVLIIRRLKLPGAWLAGFIFALHPVAVESVAWITEQKNTLSAVFYLASALTYLRFDETRRKGTYFLAFGLFAAALASKSATVILPAALLVVLWWMRGRIDWRRDVLPLAPWAGLAAAYGLLTAYVERVYAGAKGAAFSLSLVEHLLLAGRMPWFYAAKLLWPVNLIFYYPRWKIDSSEWWQYLFPAGLMVVAAGLVALARRDRGPLAGFLIFIGSLFPVMGFLNIFYFRYSYVADHFQYLASLGIIVPVAAMLVSAARRRQLAKTWRIALPAMLIVVLAVLTWRQSGMYTDRETLYRETLARNPNAWLAHDNLGTILLEERGQRDEAMEHFRAAIAEDPDYWEAHLSLGNALLGVPGKLDDAIAEYRAAVRLAPDSVRTRTNLGNALLQAGRTEEAMDEYRAALRIEPDNAATHRDLAAALTRMPDRLPDAIAEYQAALRLDPDFAEAHNDLGHVLAVMPGRLPDAMVQFEAAIRIHPDYWGAHINLGTAYLQLPGRLSDAVAEFATAVRLRPDAAVTHSHLAYAMARMPGRIEDAVNEYRRALQIDPNDAEARAGYEMVLRKR